MVKRCAIISSSTRARALFMIGLIGLSTVNCAEANCDDSVIETMRRSPSPSNEESALNPENQVVALVNETEIAPFNDFDVATLFEGPRYAQQKNSISSVSSSSGCSFPDFIEEYYGDVGILDVDDSTTRMYRVFMDHMSNLHNLKGIFVDDGGMITPQGEEDEEEEYEIFSGTDFHSDAIPSSSYESNVKTLGGSKESLITSIPAPQAELPINEAILESVNENFTLYPSVSASSIVDMLSEVDQPFSPHSLSHLRMRSGSPITRPSRASSIELDLATAAITAASSIANIKSNNPVNMKENQIREELMNRITQDSIYPINRIDNYASDKLYTDCKNVGTYILNHLSQQAAKMPVTPSTQLAYELLEQLGRVFTNVIQTLSPDNRLEYEDIVLRSLEVTIVDDTAEYNSYRTVRDALILLMMDYPDIFSDEFLRQKAVYDILRAIIIRSNALKQFDTLDYIRLLSNFPNNFDLQQYFAVKLNIPERKFSEDFFLPLKEANLHKKFSIESEYESQSTTTFDKNNKKSSKKSLIRKKSKKETGLKPIKHKSRYSNSSIYKFFNGLYVLLQFGWLNRVILFRAIFVAFLLQIFLLRK